MWYNNHGNMVYHIICISYVLKGTCTIKPFSIFRLYNHFRMKTRHTKIISLFHHCFVSYMQTGLMSVVKDLKEDINKTVS